MNISGQEFIQAMSAIGAGIAMTRRRWPVPM